MKQTQTQDISNKLDTIITLLNNIATNNIKNINEVIQEREEPTLTEEERGYNVIDALTNHNLPNDIDFANEITKLIEKLRLTPNNVEVVFNRLELYQKENDIKDIRKLTFKFIHNYKQELRTGTYNNKPKKTYRKCNSYE